MDWMEWRLALCGIHSGSPGRKLSERAGSPMVSLYFHSCQQLLLQMSNSIRSLATCQGIELYCGNVPKTKIFWRGHHANTGWVLEKCGGCYFHCVVWQYQTYCYRLISYRFLKEKLIQKCVIIYSSSYIL